MPAIYVDAIAGSNLANGLTPETAVQTPGNADAKAKALFAAADEDVEVLFRRGQEHNFSASIFINNTHNRSAGVRLRYGSYGTGDRAWLTARTAVTGWEMVVPTVSQVRAPFTGVTRDVWCGDRQYRFTRSTQGRDNAAYSIFQWEPGTESVIIAGALVPDVATYDGLEMVVQQGWNLSILPVDDIVPTGVGLQHRVTFKAAAASAEFAKGTNGVPGLGFTFSPGPYHNNSGQRFWWQHAQEFLPGSPGSWWHDEANGLLYLELPDGMSGPAELEGLGVYVPNGVERIFSVTGSGTPDAYSKAEAIDVDGLGFRHVGYVPSNPDEGWVGYSAATGIYDNAGVAGYRQILGAVYFFLTESVSVTNCRFEDMSVVGVRGLWGLHGVNLSGNGFARMATSAIHLNGVASGTFGGQPFSFDTMPEGSQNIGLLLSDNVIVDTGEYYPGSAIFAGPWRSARILYNHIARCTDDGISINTGARWYGLWTQDNIIAFNDIMDVMTLTTDGGAIYSAGNMSGRLLDGPPPPNPPGKPLKVFGNRIRRVYTSGFDPGGGHSASLYMDLGSQGNIYIANDIADTSLVVNHNAAQHNTIVGNRCVDYDELYDVAYAGVQIFSPGAGTSIQVWPPLNNPPNATDMDKFNGTGAYAGAAFKNYFPFATPQDVITTGGVYNHLSRIENNGPDVPWAVRRIGPSPEVLEQFPELVAVAGGT